MSSHASPGQPSDSRSGAGAGTDAWRTWPVGTRVVVRYRTHAPAGEPQHTDVVGHVESVDAAGVRVRDRHGRVVAVAADDVALGKPVPPAPQRRTRRTVEPDEPDDED